MSGSGSAIPLVFIETNGRAATPGSLGLLAAARRLAGGAAAVVCGPGAEAVAGTLHRYGADQTWYSDLPGFDPELSGPLVDAVMHLIATREYQTVLLETSVVAMDVAAGLAARLEAGVNWDLQDIAMRDGRLVGTRFALGDTIAVEVGWTGDIRLAVFRLGMFEPVEMPVTGSVQRFEPSFSSQALRTTVTERRDSSREGARLADAEVIVAGGRGVRDAGSLQLLEALASALDGMVAVSMPLVDRGWYPATSQVGQTGQKVRPRLYIACGISGSLAHRVGMEKSGTIIAINSDPSAPIFGLCDAGVVGDLHRVVPELTERIGEARAAGGVGDRPR